MMTPMEAFKHLKPGLDEATKLITSAPLSLDDRAYLALMVTGHFLGVSAAAYAAKLGDASMMKQVLDVIRAPGMAQ